MNTLPNVQFRYLLYLESIGGNWRENISFEIAKKRWVQPDINTEMDR